MKVKATMVIGNIRLECEAEGVKDLMYGVSEYLSVLGHNVCDKCKSTNVVPECREDAKGYRYYSMTCLNCGRAFSFGQHGNERTLFPKDPREFLHYQDRKRLQDQG